jgi:hypothetical protein
MEYNIVFGVYVDFKDFDLKPFKHFKRILYILYYVMIFDTKLPYTRKESKMPKIPIFAVCAAAFAFAAAQSDSDDSPFGSAAESSFESYDIGPYSAGNGSGSGEASAEDAAGGNGAKKKSAEKPPKEKTSRGKRSGPSFSSAFSGPQKACPVCSSVRLKNNEYVDYSGGRIHVCSAACIDRVRRNPAAFAEILLKRGEQLANP